MSNQANPIMETGPMTGYPFFTSSGWQSKSEQSFQQPQEQEEIACPVSLYQAAMLSRNPARVHDLAGMLSEQCFDVMMMRRWEPRLTSALTTGLIIADMTECASPEAFHEERSLLLLDGISIPVMYLVGEALMNRASGSMLDEELMVWPARSPQSLMYQIRRSIRVHASSSPMMSEEAGNRSIYKDLFIDRDKMTVMRGSTTVHLTKTEYSLLILLLDSEGAVRTREDLMSRIWDTDFVGGSNVVDVHIKSLRKKLGDHAGAPRYIATVRGVGYRLAD
ncbi:winged helix-turn-helix domain-containing protein [Paenibacillus lemnae]|uniref:Winged helix-turn-helix transcriptional regulator n=1 Tax=Paenibacillus lemnae TaxID=1330551 RepID=A0A848M309_PAELE|nr:winged helix-turn-helix domain-containing protein [Paenibacillus lemnae]NMO94502.1 winged helix-turn-helix transcriptional regulator [Paenibacillus lemnae]